jgi:dephospho-CoA kinase
VSYVVGVTGGIGSGKSAVTARLEKHGITVVDADVVSRVIVEPGRPALDAIASYFGSDILLADGNLDRAALRTQVFANPEQRHWLEKLTHPLIAEEIVAQLAASKSPYTLLSSPLLLETAQSGLTQCVIVVDVSEALQVARTMNRDSNDEDQVRRIIAVQMNREQRLKSADIVIDNSTTLEALNHAVDALHDKLLLKADESQTS